MKSILEAFNSMAMPLKLAFTASIFGCLMGAMYAFTSDPRVVWILLIGLVAVVLLLLAYKALLAQMQKRKAAPMEKSILGNAAATPQGISAPAKRASIDDLRKKFETGLATFKSVGKNLYSLPWYMIVGEPGAGKTEAIRHCNVGFPPGLHDQFQGAGGTINMNWWFTNHAVMLDTAGRLMFEEIQPGATSEWQEFLKLLATNRPSCPINGLLLVIPADTLVRDTADQIEAKGAKIATQLDNIQRALGVRFPVFVIITKCDLVNGFREFFDQLNDPQSQHQMMGWSNPAPLDEPFDPARVDQHLKTVVQRLERRRLKLMLDPVNTQDPGASRTSQVDSLFALPQSLLRIVPRLRRYLEMVFVAGEWSAKPLFLRGIYLTSSMREGTALDADLAEALGVPVDSLPEGRVWERDRAYFLRDLFMEKVFKEKGLVTNARSAERLSRRRTLAVLGTGFVGVIILFLLTWLGATSLKASVGHHRDYWFAAAEDANWPDTPDRYWRPIVVSEFAGSPNYVYTGGDTIKVASKPMRTDQFQDEVMAKAQQPIQVPWIFRFASSLSGNVKAKQATAQQVLYDRGVLWPLIDAARRKMAAEKGPWTPQATDALAQLIRIESNEFRIRTGQEKPRWVDLAALSRYVLGKADYQPYRLKERDVLQTLEEQTYSRGQSRDLGTQWPGASSSEASSAAVRNGVTLFLKSLSPSGQNARLASILTISNGCKAFVEAEGLLLQVDDAFPGGVIPETSQASREPKTQWTDRFGKVKAAKEELDKSAATLGESTLTSAYDQAMKDAVGETVTACQVLQDETAQADERSVLPWVRTQLASASESLKNRFKDAQLVEELKKYDADNLAQLQKDQSRLFAMRFQMYELANGLMAGSQPVVTMANLAERIKETRTAADNSLAEIDKLAAALGKTFRAEDGAAVSRFALRLKAALRYNVILNDALESVPPAPAKIAEAIAAQAKSGAIKPPPTVPLTKVSSATPFDPKYHAESARVIFAAFKQLGDTLADKSLPVVSRDILKQQYDLLSTAFGDYMTMYVNYWTDVVPGDLKPKPLSWDAYYGELAGIRVAETHEAIEEYCKRIAAALPSSEELPKDNLKKKVTAAQSMIDATLKQTAKSTFVGEVKDVLASWGDLRKDPNQAKATLLALKPTQLSRKYFILSTSSGNDYATLYWENLTCEALRALADEGQGDAIKAFQRLDALGRFPLVKYRSGDKELTLSELDEARNAWKLVTGNADPKGGDAEFIAQGAETGNPRLDTQLRRMRGLYLSDKDQKWFVGLRKLFDVLPEGKAEFECKISILPASDQEKDRNSVLDVWADIAMTQGDGKAMRFLTGQKEEQLLGTALCPGDKLAFDFYRHPGDKDIATSVKVPGPWACLRLIHLLSAGQTTDGKIWTVKLAVDDAGVHRTIRLKLEFAKPLPPLAEWPDRN